MGDTDIHHAARTGTGIKDLERVFLHKSNTVLGTQTGCSCDVSIAFIGAETGARASIISCVC